MSLKAKYHYTHFIYPFVVENNKYQNFLESLIKDEKKWKLNIHEYKNDEELYNFFLPYMRKFLFPTLFWEKDFLKQYKNYTSQKKSQIASKMSSVSFEYNLDNIKTGSVSNRQYGVIDFDISNIKIICFESGICFLDIKAEIDEAGDSIDFDQILDFNHYFRDLTPRGMGLNGKTGSVIKGRNIDSIENITLLISSVIKGFETKDLEKIYYDKMFTYSYACVDGWKKEEDFAKIENDFYRFQYVMDSKNNAVFNKNCERLKEDTYSRWQYSKFGFSRESGVVLVSDTEKYNITRMPYNFEKTYLYVLLLAFYQRISLINFSQDLLKKDKTMIKKLKNNFTKFTHFSWFSQITNSEHGMDIWGRWQDAFQLKELYEEVQKEYIEYYDFVVATGQDRINILLIMLYTVSVLFAGLQIITNFFGINGMETLVITIMVLTALSYPIFMGARWIKHKIEARINK